jgi:ferredoxin
MIEENAIQITLTVIFLAAAGGFYWFAYLSMREDERRAKNISLCLGTGFVIISILVNYLVYYILIAIFYTITVVILLTAVLLLLPIGRHNPGKIRPQERVDERTIVFARARLQQGTDRYRDYYRQYPEHEALDDRNRARPGLLSPTSRHANPYAFASAESSFNLIDGIQIQVEGQPSADRLPIDPEQAAGMVKGLARYYGALDVGITSLQPYHLYSHIGRGSGEYGAEIPLEHRYAIAITVEMDFEIVGCAPTAPITMESSKQYVEAAVIAAQLAETIRNWGYPARAHIDGNYRVICPLVARDAGLGEIGRMSILITPHQGPRVRLAVVTTGLELSPDPAPPQMDVIDFCTICKKCAENCPSRSISMGDREDKDGLRWVLNAETCFAYWNEIGTDCGICMRVCPYSHPGNPAHNLVRWGIRRSGVFRRAALKLDDLFYGRHPKAKSPPSWLRN